MSVYICNKVQYIKTQLSVFKENLSMLICGATGKIVQSVSAAASQTGRRNSPIATGIYPTSITECDA